MKVKVSAVAKAGFFRAGIFWPNEGRIVDPEELGSNWERLAAEPNLRISPVSAEELASGPSDDELRAAVMTAFGTLPGDAFGKDGKPKMEPLREALGDLGKLVTSELRDAVWSELAAPPSA